MYKFSYLSVHLRERLGGACRGALAIDSKLRGCDVVSIKVEDIAPGGYTVDRATVRQKKTGNPVRFEITEQTRQALDDYIRTEDKKGGDFLFIGRKDPNRCLTTRQYTGSAVEFKVEKHQC